MAKLILTSDRWDELSALLEDDQRLQREYPKVAEYLSMAERLPGVGDEQADAQFSLRFVHYLTGGTSESMNPYWDIVEPFVTERSGRRVVNGGRAQGSPRLAFAQMQLQGVYAHAIPAPQTIEWISEFSGGRPIVELGAGRGYWAAQIARQGLSIEAYDSDPPDSARSISFPGAAGQVDVWHPVGDLDGFAARAMPADYALFLCWPPGWGDSMAFDALTSFEAAGGERLIYIGERKGGKTGNDAFFDALSARWKLESVDRDFVSWWTEEDVAEGWVRA
ncbi:hypothetical protein [Actinocorallia longicatena]|uniref:Class I SAM-dependent methyltransferase n=1 Tax=Actinocorallia longicatena TaxID=111803 RepID=A0ABP6QJU6_9ACTN